MNTVDLKKQLTLALNKLEKTNRCISEFNVHELGELDESARAALDALQSYLQKSDDLIAWIKNNVPEFPFDLESLMHPARPTDDSSEALPAKNYGEFTEENALKLLEDYGKLSTSLLQRKFFVGYAKAAKMLDALSQKGYVQHTDKGWKKI